MKVCAQKINEYPMEFEVFPLLQELSRVTEEFQLEKNGFSYRASLQMQAGAIHLAGKYKIQLQKPCDCCLETAKKNLTGQVDLILLPNQQGRDSLEEEIFIDGPNVDFFSRGQILLTEYFLDQLFLDIGTNAWKCGENCWPICLFCQLRQNQCSCEKQHKNHPFLALKELIDSFNS